MNRPKLNINDLRTWFLKRQLLVTTKRRKLINGLVCPGCSEIGTLRKIIYGMPDPESFDFEKYAVGGCCMNGDGSDPDISCRTCDWSGFRESLNPNTYER